MKKVEIIIVFLFLSNAVFSQFCKDTSFRKIYTVSGANLRNYHYFADRNDSTFIAGSIISTPDTSYYVARVANDGSIPWASKIKFNSQIANTTTAGLAGFSDNSVLVLFSQTGDTSLQLLRFDFNGNLLYTKIICGLNHEVFNETRVKVIDDDIYIITAALPQSGPEIDKHYNAVFKLDANASLLWSKYYGDAYDCVYSTPTSIVKRNGDLIVIGRTLPSECMIQPPSGLDRSIYTLVLNPTNGAMVNSVNYTAVQEFNPSGSTVGLTVYNDISEVNGKLFYTGALSSLYTGKVGGYKAELDNNLEFINAGLYYYNGNNPSGFTRLSVNQNENTDILLADKSSLTARSIYFGKFDSSGHILRQKKLESLTGTNFSFMGRSPLVRKAGYLNLFTTFNNAGIDCIQLTRLANDEQNDNCYGQDTSFIKIEPFPITKYQTPYFDQAKDIGLSVSPIVVTQVPLNITVANYCQQISMCNSLVLHKSPDTVCNLSLEYTFYAQINDDCKKHLAWSIDTSAIEYITPVDDTTVHIKFKKEWTGYLYASVSSCSVLKDSVLLHVYDTPHSVGLGADTVLCSGQTLTLQPKIGFMNYRWEDNSITRIRTVSSTGQYSLIAEDYCHNLYYDTINIRYYAPVQPVHFGSDTALCAGQALLLDAGAGYKYCAWQDGTSSENYTVSQAGQYFVKATDSCENVFSDTINVKYYIARLPVSLGADKIYCVNQVYHLDAGAGYKTYSWQNASTLQTFDATQPGLYNVTVTDSCGNVSQDQLEIFPAENIVININYIKPVCINDTAQIMLPLAFHNFSVQPASEYYLNNNMLVLFPASNTLYTLSGYSAGGCLFSGSFKINVIDCGDAIFFPSAFTPNGDGLNDIFRAKTHAKTLFFNFSVFNRYGEKVFQSNDIQRGWDGYFKDKRQGTGSYTWQCSYTLTSLKTGSLNGSVILLH